jgi:hypothetical protein
MSKNIYLDNLVSFSSTTYSNCYDKFINLAKIDLVNEINKLRSNNSINEKGVFIQYNYIELATLMDFKYNELVLVYPISFNIENENKYSMWYNFLNALLLMLNNDYFNESNNIKKKYLDSLNEQLEKKIKFTNNGFDDKVFESIINTININLIILNYTNDTKIKIYKNNNLVNKYIIIYRLENEFLPVCDFNTKYYTDSSSFVKYLQEEYNKLQETKQNVNLEINKEESKINKNDYYDEFQTIEDYTLHVSEAVDNKQNKELNSDNKKKKIKNDKNIFITNKTEKKKEEIVDNNKIEDESVFNKTEIITKDEIIKIYNSFKSTTKLEDIQSLCLKANIPIFAGSTKEGKPKNKTKSELLDDIKKYIG